MNTEATAAGARGTRHTGVVVYSTICTGIVAVLFLTNWPTYDYSVRGGPIPLYFYVVPVLFIVPILFAEPPAALRVVRQPLFWWFLTFVLTGFVWLLVAQDFMEDASAQWRLRVLALMFFSSVSMLAYDARSRTVGWVIVFCMLLASAFNWIDVLRPHRFVPEGIEGATEGRGAGLFMNPNAAGSFIVMAAIAALPLIPGRLRTLLLVSAVFGVAATFSRGAFVMVSVAVAGAIGLRLIRRAEGMLLVLALPALIAGVSLSYDYLIDKSENRHIKNVVQRLNWFHDVEDEDLAVEGRKYGASQAWQMFLDSPVLGAGPGATSRAIQQEGPHNMYLLLMAEQGVFGFFLYVSLLALAMREGRRLMQLAPEGADRDIGRGLVLFSVFLATYGFFSHNVLEEPFTMFLLAFLVAAAASARARLASAWHPAPAHRARLPRPKPAT